MRSPTSTARSPPGCRLSSCAQASTEPRTRHALTRAQPSPTTCAPPSIASWSKRAMAESIEFYFDFSSPYGYLASTRIDAIAAKHGRQVTWRPFLLGAAFKVTGQQPLVEQPLRGDYSRRDFARSARLLGVPLKMPEPFPFFGLAASRACYWIEDAGQANALAKAIYCAA